MSELDAYRVETVERCNAPRGVTDGEWCRYVVTGHSSKIVGRFRGTLAAARRNAEHLADGLNSRNRNGKSPWAPKGRSRKTH